MSETSFSLLERLRVQPDDASWKRLVDLYTPLLQKWLRRHFLLEADAEDLVQEVLAVLVREVPRFEHNGQPGAFRRWLRGILVHRLQGFWRARQGRPQASGDSDLAKRLEQLEDPASGLSRLWDQEHDHHVMARMLESIACEFSATTWQCFQRHVLQGETAAAVAADLAVSVNVVLLAKSRVLRRLRQEAQGLLD